ncbi:four-carbon acid sugar kinase family protein [uncultured Frigoribacterium sp.]|uniref:four-carbon acid sugar kinase family protein n=1 Tax=uncultured Frigoribacterium sp. TaxID=335377 RepID=UPI0028D087D9|nr:four-carbon acid sugar kinase family protein [uncultured Frigoribacterium sp.]
MAERVVPGHPPGTSSPLDEPGPLDRHASLGTLVVLDDDPTGTQTVTDLPIITRWEPDDVRWALDRGAPAFAVLTNTRSLDRAEARARTAEVVRAVLAAAGDDASRLRFVSRGDSTLRGHHVDEVETIVAELAAVAPVDAVVMVPAFPSAGRTTVDGVHLVREGDELVPAGRSSFAGDPTFGYSSSHLADWLEERSGGRIAVVDVATIDLEVVRGPVRALADALLAVRGGRHVAVDAETDDDLARIVEAGELAERAGRNLLWRIGPGLLRPLVGQVAQPALAASDLAGHVAAAGPATPHGLIVVGSHVPLTTRQVERLDEQAGPSIELVVVDVPALLRADRRDTEVTRVVAAAVSAMADRDVVVTTSRVRVDGHDGGDSLRIAREVSRALVELTRAVDARARPSFVVGKGGITSSDLATEALGLRRAVVLGTLLPGAVSVWLSADEEARERSADPPASRTPYAVFPGNVGTDDSLWAALSAFRAAAVKATG